MNDQISIFELMTDTSTPHDHEIALPSAYSGEKVYVIPDDVWENRCSKCIHKNGPENWPVPFGAVYRQQYAELIPCRIMTISRPNDRPGECMSFAPRMDVFGICGTCKHDNIFCDGFCMKEDHAEQRRVFYGKDYGGDARKIDYYGRHRLSVCDDYEPDEYAREAKT